MKAMRIILSVFFALSLAVHSFFSVRERIGRDTVAPVITADSDEFIVSVADGDEKFLEGMHAEDNKDGDVTDSIILVAKLDFIEKGTFKVNYAAFDKANNVTTYVRKATYSDYRSPRFVVSTPLRYDDANSSSMLSNIRVDDVLDGNITADMRITYENVEGTRNPVILQVTNSAGDTSVISLNAYLEDRIDAAVPTPALDQYIIYTGVGQVLDPGARVIGYYQNRGVREFSETSEYSFYNIDWDDSGVDYNTPGEYVITYNLFSDEGEYLGSTELYVIVEGS